MHWKFDIDQRSLSRALDDRSVKSAKLAFPDKYPLRVDVLRGETPYVFSGKVKATLKVTNNQVGDALAENETLVSAASTANLVLNLATLEMQAFITKFGERPAVLEIMVQDSTLGAEVASWPVSCDLSRRYES
jgi:hypothetical protein